MENTNTLLLNIKGIPKAKQSFKYTRTGKKYTPTDVKTENDNIRTQIINQLPANFIPFDGYIVLSATFVFPPITSMRKREKEFIKNGGYIRKNTKPDLTNLMKLIEDSMEGIIFINDSQICGYKYTYKIYGNTPGIIIKIEKLIEKEKSFTIDNAFFSIKK